MIARKCDRCEKLYDFYNFYNKFDDEYQNGFAMIYKNLAGMTEQMFKGIDLCPECMQDLIDWLNKKENNNG